MVDCSNHIALGEISPTLPQVNYSPQIEKEAKGGNNRHSGLFTVVVNHVGGGLDAPSQPENEVIDRTHFSEHEPEHEKNQKKMQKVSTVCEEKLF